MGIAARGWVTTGCVWRGRRQGDYHEMVELVPSPLFVNWCLVQPFTRSIAAESSYWDMLQLREMCQLSACSLISEVVVTVNVEIFLVLRRCSLLSLYWQRQWNHKTFIQLSVSWFLHGETKQQLPGIEGCDWGRLKSRAEQQNHHFADRSSSLWIGSCYDETGILRLCPSNGCEQWLKSHV